MTRAAVLTLVAATRVVAIATVVLASRAAFAYRPFDQTDGDTAEFNTIELELGPIRFTRGNNTTLFEPGGVFNYGFSPGWELVVDMDGYIPLPDGGGAYLLTDFEVKHVLRDGVLQDKTGPSIALEIGPLFPTVPNLPDEAGLSADLIVSERWRGLTAHVNLQVEYTRERQVAYTGGAIFEAPQDWRVRPVGEAYLERSDGVDFESYLVGAIWPFHDHLTFDAALRMTRSEGVDAGEIRVGLTWVLET